MHLDYTPEQQALRKELRAYFDDLLTDEVRAALGVSGAGSPLFRTLVARMGADGWLGVGWPKEYGGQGRPPTDQFIVFDEVQRAGAPFPFVTVNTVGPTIMRFNALRTLSTMEGGAPGPEASITKLYWATWHRNLGELAVGRAIP